MPRGDIFEAHDAVGVAGDYHFPAWLISSRQLECRAGEILVLGVFLGEFKVAGVALDPRDVKADVAVFGRALNRRAVLVDYLIVSIIEDIGEVGVAVGGENRAFGKFTIKVVKLYFIFKLIVIGGNIVAFF